LVRFYLRDRDARLRNWEPDFARMIETLDTGIRQSDVASTTEAFEAGDAPWPHNYLFLPEELEGLLVARGITDVRMSGPGAMSRRIPNEILKKVLLSEQHREDFLNICYRFDSHPAVCGLGKDNLVASGSCGAQHV
jgi:hypothetical protein